MRLILTFLSVLSLASPIPAWAQNPLTFVQAGQWPQALAAASRSGDPVADKVILWLRVLTPNAAGAAEIAAFMRSNPEWPLPSLMERRRQEAIAIEPNATTAAALCIEKTPTPSPARGPAMARCAGALADTGRGKEAGALARQAWVSAIGDPATEAAFLSRFPGVISAADQWARFQRLAWDDAAGAQRQIAYLDPAQAGAAAARLALKTNAAAYTPRPEEDPGAMLDLARMLRKLDQNQAAVALWRASGPAAQKAAPDHLEAFWSERHALARKLLRDGDPRGAYLVVAGHGQTEAATAVEAEFLAGFIALRRLNDPKAAAAHFTALAGASQAVLTQSRAYYWLGRASVAAARPVSASPASAGRSRRAPIGG
jgi:soluble lytic murein transglycosylase